MSGCRRAHLRVVAARLAVAGPTPKIPKPSTVNPIHNKETHTTRKVQSVPMLSQRKNGDWFTPSALPITHPKNDQIFGAARPNSANIPYSIAKPARAGSLASWFHAKHRRQDQSRGQRGSPGAIVPDHTRFARYARVVPRTESARALVLDVQHILRYSLHRSVTGQSLTGSGCIPNANSDVPDRSTCVQPGHTRQRSIASL